MTVATTPRDERPRRTRPARASDAAFAGVSALLFAVSAATTGVWSGAMSAMGGTPMPGGWTMSMTWTRMPGQSWLDAAASFLGMWDVMMVAMMLPSLVPMLWRYRRSVVGTDAAPLGLLTALAGAGYFSVWTVLGMAAFPLGAVLTTLETSRPALARAAPVAAGVVVAVAGAWQLTGWKTRRLACCRQGLECERALPDDAGTAWRHGVRLGVRCGASCANLTAILLAVGVMDVRAMAVVGAAVAAERLAPAGARLAHATGAVAVGAGMLLIARATGLG